MASNNPTPRRSPPQQSIPLQNLPRPSTASTHTGGPESFDAQTSTVRHSRTKSLFERGNRSQNYTRLDAHSPTRAHLSEAETSYEPFRFSAWSNAEVSPIEDESESRAAPIGLSVVSPVDYAGPSTPDQSQLRRPSIIATTVEGDQYDLDTTPLRDIGGGRSSFKTSESTSRGQRHDRDTRRSSVHWFENESPTMQRGRQTKLGDDLRVDAETAVRNQHLSTNSAVSRLSIFSMRDRSRSRSPSASPSPMARANSIFREISQRVVNLSNDTDMVEQSIRRRSSVHQDHIRRGSATHQIDDPEPGSSTFVNQAGPTTTTVEKAPSEEVTSALMPTYSRVNPLRGKTWGIFGPENPLRKFLCEVLVHPMTEPVILVLIVAQAVLLAVSAAPDAVYMQARYKRTGFDHAILALFIIYTIEVLARTIVSGFVMNPKEYSTLDRSKGIKQGITLKLNRLFAPPKHQSIQRAETDIPLPVQPSIVRTFTGMPEIDSIGPGRQQRRIRLARRAFLRHSFNRLDFVAVVSFWISFGMRASNYENNRHVYVFNMLSCLRILRLLGLTAGTSIILRSLKKAASLLVHVAFLIGFFWLIFGIIGVQSFKSSLRRTCVWIGDDGSGQNYTLNQAPGNIQFCGGYLDGLTGAAMPFLTINGNLGATSAKGYLCPEGSLCVENGVGPYNGTVSFDNIFQSLELVFVIISSNTWSDLLYYLTDTDYLAAACFFAAAIVVLSLWLVNLLVAVITSSFQIIREESKQSAFTAVPIDEPPPSAVAKSRASGLKRLYQKTSLFWVILIMFDLVVQSFTSATMSSQRQKFISTTETIVTLALLVEIILRFICDWRHFFKSKRNCIDLFLAITTTIIQIPPIHNSGLPYAWLTTLQILRIYRVVMAVRITRELIMIVVGNIVGLMNLIVFVVLFTFLAAILASQLFRGDFPPQDASGETVHIQFFDIWNSFVGMYQVLSSENWTSIMYNATQYDLLWDTAWLGALFFIIWFITANLIVLNMFIAVIQESFDVSEDEKRLQQVKQFLKQKELNASSSGNLSLFSIMRLGRETIRHREALEYGTAAMEQLLKDAVVSDFLDEQDASLKPRPTMMHLTEFPSAPVNTGFLSRLWTRLLKFSGNKESNPFYSNESVLRADEDFDPRAAAKQVFSTAENRRKEQRQYLQKHPRYNVSLFVFEPHNFFRRMCQYLVGPGRGDERVEGVSPYGPAWFSFSAFIYAAVVAMVVLACITTPLYQREYYQTHSLSLRNWFVWTDLGFAIVFSAEAIIKSIADGFYFTPHAAYRNVWGAIDGVVLVTLWINVITAMVRDDGVSRAVGAFKALRALRLLNISDSAKNTFYSVIIVGGYKIIGVMFVSLSLLIPFAILGLNLFNGQMQACNDGDFGYTGLSNCVGEFNSTPFNWPVLAPRQVANPYYSFDNFGSSLFILFQIVSQEGWTDVMWSAMSIVGRGQQPQDFASQGNAVYFIVFNLLGAVFVLTLFISVFMRNYTEQTGVAFLTAEQRSWLELRKILKQISPSKRSLGEQSKSWQRHCYEWSVHKKGKWSRFVTGILIFHLILLVTEYYPEPHLWEMIREYLLLMTTLFLMANIFIRIFGLSWPRFVRNWWDVYSVFSVSGTFVTSVMRVATLENLAFIQLHKLFLVSITFLLIPRNNQLDQLFKTAAASLPLIANLLATWFVLFLVYAIAFTQSFGLTRFGENESSNVNFRTVPKALILLFRTSIGEGWNALMEDFATIEPPFCTREDNFFDSDCGSDSWARVLFISWNIISMYIFVSLFVSLIFESFSYVYQRSSGLSIVSRDEIRRFKHAWSEFDPNGTGYISKEIFPRLLGELSGVFQMRIYDGDFTVRNIIEDCTVQPDDVPEPNRRVVAGIDLNKLAERLNHIPVRDIRARRERMNVFYQEMLLLADPDRGISFTSCLMTLAHYNVISDNHSLRLEEFLQRRVRLQRVHESIRRATVVGFFDTIYWTKRFRAATRDRISARLAGPPQLPVPEIFIDHPDEGLDASGGTEPHDFTDSAPLQSPTKRRAPRLPPIDTSLRDSIVSTGSAGFYNLSPVSSLTNLSPNRQSAGEGGFANQRRSPPVTPTLARSRHTSTADGLNGAGLMESFDASAWAESIRRSFTTRRSR